MALVPMMILPLVLLAQDVIIRGRVADPQGNACPNASIQIMKGDVVVAEVRSAADGRFSLVPPPAGGFTIKVEVPGFRPVTQPLTVDEGSSNAEITISMRKLSATQTGQATDLGMRKHRWSSRPEECQRCQLPVRECRTRPSTEAKGFPNGFR